MLIHFPNIPVEIPEEFHDDMSARLEYLKSFLEKVDLFNHDFEVKLADFGFAKQVQDMTETILGAPLFMAPEIMKGKVYNNQVDVWSLGVVFFEMLTGFTPFIGKDKMDLLYQIEKGVYRIPKRLKLSLPGLGGVGIRIAIDAADDLEGQPCSFLNGEAKDLCQHSRRGHRLNLAEARQHDDAFCARPRSQPTGSATE